MLAFTRPDDALYFDVCIQGCRTLLIHAAARGIPLHGASVPQPVATERAFSPRLFGVVVILRHPVAL